MVLLISIWSIFAMIGIMTTVISINECYKDNKKEKQKIEEKKTENLIKKILEVMDKGE